MDRKLPTCGQIERDLSQRIQKLYREQLGHSPRKITCKLFDNRLAVVIENSLTVLQKTLIEEDNQNEISQYVNSAIDNVIKLKLKTAIEEVLEIEVFDILYDSSAKSNSAGAIAILTESPSVRKRDLIPKIRKDYSQNKSTEQKSSSIDGNTSVSANELETSF